MPAAETTRKFTVTGNVGARFIIIALQNPSSSSDHTLYYDFTNTAFEAGHNDLNNNLIVTLFTNTYSDSITFPSGAGEFVIKLMAIGDTELQNSNTNIITKSISKLADPEITFTPGTLTTTANIGVVALCKAEKGYALAVYWEGGWLSFVDRTVRWNPKKGLEVLELYCRTK